MPLPSSKNPNRILLASGNFFFKCRNFLFPAVFIMLFLFTRPALFLNNPELDRLIVLSGILIAFAGQLFRFTVIGFAYIKRGGKEGKVYADDLVIQGFYAHVRNPMYVGNFLITVGIGIVYSSPWIYIFVIPFFTFVYLSIVTAEENYLRQKFGAQFEHYENTVNRFIPNFSGLQKTLKDFKYDWKKALRKEYGTVFGTMAGILLILIWKNYYLFGWDARKEQIINLALLLIPAIIFYATVRALKLSKRLAS